MKAHLTTRKTLTRSGCGLAIGALTAVLALAACGSPQQGSGSLVTGVVSADAPATGTVSLKDSSAPVQERLTTINPDGSYAVEANGLTAPYLLRAQTAEGTKQYAVAPAAGTTDINALTTTAVAASSESDDPEDAWSGDHDRVLQVSGSILKSLRTVLAPLFQHYGITFGEDWQESSAFRTMMREVSFTVANGTLTVTNKATGGVIYTAPMTALTSGTVNTQNIPGATPTPTPTPPPPPAIDGAALYTSDCAGCHGPLATSSKLGRTAAQIQAAINGVSAMSSLKSLTSAQIDAIAAALAGTTQPPPPSACTYSYSAWGACQSNGTQTRTVTSSSPAGCTGTPVLSQSCTYTPPVTTCTGFTYSAWGACQSNGTQTRTVIGSTPSGCTGGSPVLSQSCTYVPPVTTCTSFTYSAWGACQSNDTQTRTVTSSSPSGCTGGSPVLSQSCTYVPPTCTSFTYSAWGACQSNNTQTRTVTSSSPAGCAGGTPVLSQSCTYTAPNPVTKAMVTSSCTTCHGLTSNTTVFKSGGYTVSGRSATQWLSTVNSMVGMGAQLAPGTTAQNYADYLATAP